MRHWQRMARGRHRRRRPIPGIAVLGALVLGALGSAGRSTAILSHGRSEPVGPAPVTAPASLPSPRPSAKPEPPPIAQPEAIQTGAVAQPKSGWAVQIPAIGVDAKVNDLGLNSDGTLQVPADFSVAGWYSLGPKPGDVGPAVIVGHVDSRNGPAVFYRLSDLAAGENVVVWVAKKKVTFVVDSVHEYPKTAFPTSKVYGPTHGPVLRLITGGGAFNRATGHYDDNIVVSASLAH